MEDLGAAAGQGGSDIFIWSFEAETRTRLTFDPGFEDNAVWSADSQRIVYSSSDFGIQARAADGTGAIESLLERPASLPQYPYGLDADGNVVFTIGFEDILVLDRSGDGNPTPLLASNFAEHRPALSPDGRWIAYESDETGEFEIYVRPYPDVDSGKWQVSEGGGVQAKWSADGRQIFFWSPEYLMAAEVRTEPTFRRQTPRQLFEINEYYVAGGEDRGYDVSPDGERFLMIRQGSGGDDAPPSQFIIVENWLSELERLVPTD
jgi:serine/threonine-protein kinase